MSTITSPQNANVGFKLSRLSWAGVLVGFVGAYVVLLPNVHVLPALDLYNAKRLVQVVLLAGAACILLGSSSARSQWLDTFFALPRLAQAGLAAVLGLGLLSAATAPSPGHAFLEVGHVAMLLVLAGGVATAARQAPQQTAYVVLGAASLCVLLNAVQFSVGYGMYFVMPRVDLWPEAHFGFANIRHFNQLQTWTLPLLAVPVLVLPKRWRAGKAVVFGLLAFWWMLVIASDGRGTPLAMVVAAIGAGLLFRRTAKSWLGTQLAAVAVGGGLYYLLFTVLAGATPEVVDRLGDAGEYSRRLQHWATSLELAWAQPWLGAGPMHYAWPPYHFDLGAHPHNALMQWLAEWGIPSTLLMLGLVVWGGWRWMEQERDEGRSGVEHAEALRVGLVASVLAGAAHALVSGVIVTPVSQMMLVLVLGWAWGRYRPPSRPERPTVSRRAQVALCTILVASIGITAYHVPDLAAKQERWSAFLESVERNRLSPRYWQQGYFGVRDPGVMEHARHDR